MLRPAPLLAAAAALAVLLGLAGCDSPDGEVSAEVSAAADAVTHTIEAAQPIRVAFELLDQLPEFEPGTSRDEYAAQAEQVLARRFSCALQARTTTDSTDTLTLQFPADGCLIGKHGLAGVMVFTLSGGGDCLASQIDLTDTVLDSFTVGSKASHGTCRGGSVLWSAQAAGALDHGYTYDIQGTVAVLGETGGAFSDGSTLVIDGHCILDTPDGRYSIEVDRFTYTMGDLSPHHGDVDLQHPEHEIHATLERKTDFPFERTEAAIVVDDHSPVTVVLP